MDLSYRAQLRGWQFVYLPDVVAPAELPVEMNVVQVAAVPLGQGLGAGGEEAAADDLALEDATFAQKSEAFFHLTNNFAYPLLAAAVAAAAAEPGCCARTTAGARCC